MSEIDHFKALFAKERREDRAAALAFADACASGDGERMLHAVDWLDECVDAWGPAMSLVAKMDSMPSEIQHAFLSVWIEHKTLPLKVSRRATLARALYRLLPRSNERAPMRLFRGAAIREREKRAYGFSWTSRLEIARKFAEHWRAHRGGVVFETLAPASAVLLVREDEKYYDEGEVVIDPFALTRVRVVEVLASAEHG